MFSNEAGLGSSVMVHSNSNVKEPVKQGLWGIFEVFADTIIVCTMTALVVLTSGVIDIETGAIETTSDAVLVADAFDTLFKINEFDIRKHVCRNCHTRIRIYDYPRLVSVRFQGR